MIPPAARPERGPEAHEAVIAAPPEGVVTASQVYPIHIAPPPILPRLERFYDGVRRGFEVRRRMSVR
jgi:hypothetical protein